MTVHRRIFAIAICAFVLVSTAAAQTWSPEMQVKLKTLGTPDISPDKKRVVYTVNEAVMTADKSEYLTQIWMASTDGTGIRQMTFGEKSSTNPKWSPDGSMIAFTSNRKDNRNYLYLLRADGGEAELLTEIKGSVGGFEWSPDGRTIAYTMTDPKSEDEEKNDKGRNDFRWIDENTKFARLFVIPIARAADGKREPRKLTGIDRSVGGFDWAPSGDRIAFTHTRSAVADYWPTSDISLVEVATGRITPLAATELFEGAPYFSPDGKWIAARVSDGPVRWAQSDRIAVYASDVAAPPRLMALSYDAQPSMLGWSPDGSHILFYEAKGTGTALYEANVASSTVKELDYQPAVLGSVTMTKDGNMFGFVSQTYDKPPEMEVVSKGATSPTIVSNANRDHAAMKVGKTEVIKWKSKDGREIEGLLHYPLGYTAGTKVPLILNIHGGPAGVFQNSYIGGRGAYPIASFNSKGYAVLRPNPRGSSGYGTEFRRANIKDWGGMDYEDLMTGVDHVIGMGVADPARLGVMGWSYGGYMTSTIITKTKRFKAASAGAPVTNLMSFNGTADIPSFVPDYFGGEYWDDPQTYAKHSAMFNIKGVSTPTLVQHGEADIRVPIEQGYQLYAALKRQNVPTRMLVLPRQPHGPNEPKMLMITMQSNLEWFDKYLK
jgi:dipeptidyl aminopeptidase/acylaminoacyl peptidase